MLIYNVKFMLLKISLPIFINIESWNGWRSNYFQLSPDDGDDV